MSNFYENWLTDILTNREVCDEFGEKTILPILKSAQSIDLKHDIFSPSFLRYLKKILSKH